MLGLKEHTSARELKGFVTEAFKGCFQSNKEIHMDHWDIDLPCLNRREVENLEIPFSKEKSQWELISANGNKTPNPEDLL